LLEILESSDHELWEHYSSRSKHNVFWKLHYLLLYQVEGEPEAAVYEDERGYVFYPYLKRKIKGDWLPKSLDNKYFDITSAYGFGGPIVNGREDQREALFADFRHSFEKYCLNNQIVSEFIRFHPLHSDPSIFIGHVDLVNKGPNVFVDLQKFQTEEQFLASYRTSIRYEVRKAIKLNVSIEIEDDGARLEEFLDIYYHTMRRNDATPYYFNFDMRFFRNVIDRLKGNFTFFHAIYEGKVISTALCLYDKSSVYIFLSGSYAEYFKLCPNVLLKHAIVVWAKEQGIETFLLGGGYAPNDGILAHKRGYAAGGECEASYFVGQKTHNPFVYDRLAMLKEKHANRLSPHYYPIYRSY